MCYLVDDANVLYIYYYVIFLIFVVILLYTDYRYVLMYFKLNNVDYDDNDAQTYVIIGQKLQSCSDRV